jgi:hypothetical protein
LPAIVALHETVAEPEPARLVGVKGPQVRTVTGAMLNVTVPANPLAAATVIVEVGDCPTLTGMGDVAVIVKSWNRRITKVECSREPLVPVTVTL